MATKQELLIKVAGSLGVPVEWLDNLIKFESRWNPQAKNPYSSARGLIQFTDKTAQSLGYVDSLDLVTKNNSVESQLLFPVLQYLSKFKPFKTKQDFYLSVFYPAARSWPINKEFPDSVKKVNPGIIMVSDYIAKVDNVKGNIIVNAVIVLCVIGLIKYFKG